MALGSRKKDRKKRVGALDRRLGENDERKRTSEAQEKRTAQRFAGEVQRASGATERHKGDVKTSRLLIENKTRLKSSKDGAKSMRVQASWLEKISMEARAVGKDPVLSIEIPGMTDPLCERQWVILPETLLQRLIEEIEAFQEGQ